MRTTLALATLLAVGIGGTGRAAPLAPVPVAAAPSHVTLWAYAVDQGGPATPLGTCEDLDAADRAGCRRLEASFADARRMLAYADLAKGWSGAHRAAFARLLDAQSAYATALAAHEADPGDRDAAERTEKDAFLRTLKTALRGQPAPHEGSFDSYDAELNIAYQQVMATRAAASGIDTAGVRRTERAWLAYRDAFVAFAATLEAPGAGAAVKAELTRRRAADLEAMLAD